MAIALLFLYTSTTGTIHTNDQLDPSYPPLLLSALDAVLDNYAQLGIEISLHK